MLQRFPTGGEFPVQGHRDGGVTDRYCPRGWGQAPGRVLDRWQITAFEEPVLPISREPARFGATPNRDAWPENEESNEMVPLTYGTPQ
jgi:hypothetical protein